MKKSHKRTGKSTVASNSFYKTVESIRKGFDPKAFIDLQNKINLPESRLAEILNISLSTLYRKRQKNQPFSRQESENLFHFKKLLEKAMEVFEDEKEGLDWLMTPNTYFNGSAPLEFIDTDIGYREIEALLHRMEQGVIS